MSEAKTCNGARLNYCQLVTGSAKLGTPSSTTLARLCANTGYVLNPKVSHSWIRQASYSSDWLYLEWDHPPEASTYRYFHKGDMCNAIRSAGIAGAPSTCA